MKFIIKLLTFPFWFPYWLWKKSIQLALFILIIGGIAGWFYFTQM